VEVTDSDKRSYLQRFRINYGQKCFVAQAPGWRGGPGGGVGNGGLPEIKQ